MTGNELECLFASIRRKKTGDHYEINKPLLILYALKALVVDHRITINYQLENAAIASLFADVMGRKSSPHVPFMHLTNDQGLWTVTDKDGHPIPIRKPRQPESELKDKGAKGGFSKDVIAGLTSDPQLVMIVARKMLEMIGKNYNELVIENNAIKPLIKLLSIE